MDYDFLLNIFDSYGVASLWARFFVNVVDSFGVLVLTKRTPIYTYTSEVTFDSEWSRLIWIMIPCWIHSTPRESLLSELDSLCKIWDSEGVFILPKGNRNKSTPSESYISHDAFLSKMQHIANSYPIKIPAYPLHHWWFYQAFYPSFQSIIQTDHS